MPPGYSQFAFKALVLVWLAAFAASAQVPREAERELLNSERIEQTFGSYGIQVLASTRDLRVSKLFSRHGEADICRTFAVVAYPRDIPFELAAEHAKILAGGSIGSTFAASGWTVNKAHRYFGEVDASAKLISLMGGIEPTKLAVHIYVLSVAKDDASFEYASIIEVHHPDYLRLADLHEIYGPSQTLEADAAVRQLLEITAAQMR